MLFPSSLFAFFPNIPSSSSNSSPKHHFFLIMLLNIYVHTYVNLLWVYSKTLFLCIIHFQNFQLCFVTHTFTSCRSPPDTAKFHRSRIHTYFVLPLCSHCWRQSLACNRHLVSAIVKWMSEGMNEWRTYFGISTVLKSFGGWFLYPLTFFPLLLYFWKMCCLYFMVLKLIHDQSKEKRYKG